MAAERAHQAALVKENTDRMKSAITAIMAVGAFVAAGKSRRGVCRAPVLCVDQCCEDPVTFSHQRLIPARESAVTKRMTLKCCAPFHSLKQAG